MNIDLPDDLLAFLRESRELDYDASDSEVGRITLNREPFPSTSTVFPGCQSIIDDPYVDLPGTYQIEVYDLVAEAERYQAEGLLCWIVALQRFGCIDPEHGDVITFSGVSWTNIAADPLRYLDAQWREGDAAVRVLPWIHFPYKLGEFDVELTPYGSRCPVHDSPIIAWQTRKPPLFKILRRREVADWFQKSLTTFPCSGVPITTNDMLACSKCRASEDEWLQSVYDAILPIEVSPNAHGWVQCPSCGIRFLITDTHSFTNGVHRSCGQRVNMVGSR